MAHAETAQSHVEGDLRHRLPPQQEGQQETGSAENARQVVLELNAAEEKAAKGLKDKRTYGRTPNGNVFTVPTTHDMVSQLFSPTEPKNFSDALVLAVLTIKVLAVILLPRSTSVPLFAFLFLFWRACYNVGIGVMLYEQSKNNTLVRLAKRTGIFEKPTSGKNRYPRFYSFLKREFETKISKDYKFEEAPLEYNTWLLFRRVVDLILMSDFTSYACFAIACGGTPQDEQLAMTVTRWSIGIGLFLFNLWVKLDAHRVVKDYAWYWGDFFFLVDQELTFDGVFEMAPHPMYSVGYAGFYGISLMAASYRVLAISIIGHAAQFAFLTLVESPHIEKTYNPPAPRRRKQADNEASIENSVSDSKPSILILDPIDPPNPATNGHPPVVRDIVGLRNFDIHRIIDIASALLQIYFYLFAFLTPNTWGYKAFFVINAAIWRLWYTVGLGYILVRQSNKKTWTRHFIKWGETKEEAWRQWKGIYHLSMVMCYVSFVTAAWKMYNVSQDWQVGLAALRHVVGLGLIALQLWTFFSIYDTLGEFGWFFGDFFYENGPELTYGGIYRFLNNPERFLGLAGVWGFSLITWSRAVFFLAILTHVLTLGFIQYVERPHMQRRYGEKIRKASGVSNTFKKSLPSSFRKWQGSVDNAFDDTFDIIEDFIESARPKLAAGVETFIHDTRALFRQWPARLSVTRLEPSMAGIDPKGYSLTVANVKPSVLLTHHKTSAREGELARQPSFRGVELQPGIIEYGTPIRVSWTAPANHSNKDWVGLYMLADVNSSRTVTRISSQGRWIASNQGVFDSPRADAGILVSSHPAITRDGKTQSAGEMEFAGDKLWWTTGVFEFRYHHNGAHNVLAISSPFEIRVSRFDEQTDDAGIGLDLSVPVASDAAVRSAVEGFLLTLVRNCFDRDPEIAPNSPDEAFGGLVEREGKFARRVVYGVWQAFGIELAPSVVKADGNVRNLAWRIVNAKQVLAPYSMSSSKGASTPTEEK